MVNKRVFNTLHKAEEYCEKHKLDVDENILSENPEVLEEAKNICRTVLPLLHDMKESLQVIYDQQAEIFHKKAAAYEESKTKRDLLREYKNEQSHRALGILEGILMVRNTIDRQIEIHERIIHIRK